jgi:hypothetical protein
MKVNIDGVKTKVEFDVIVIMDDLDPYTYLLGIDWAFNKKVIQNIK